MPLSSDSMSDGKYTLATVGGRLTMGKLVLFIALSLLCSGICLAAPVEKLPNGLPPAKGYSKAKAAAQTSNLRLSQTSGSTADASALGHPKPLRNPAAKRAASTTAAKSTAVPNNQPTMTTKNPTGGKSIIIRSVDDAKRFKETTKP